MGQPVNTRKKDPTKSKYPEDVCYGEHLTVWGSWWNETLGKMKFIIIRLGL